jgi:hypothetical protein
MTDCKPVVMLSLRGCFAITDPPTRLTDSVVLVRERTVPTERSLLVGEVSAKFCGYRDVAWSVWRISYFRNLGFLDRTSVVHSHEAVH